MKLKFVPLLQLQRDLYNIPKGQERFRTYLATLVNADASDVEFPPLAAMNPMGKDHIPTLLDTLLAIDADQIASLAIKEISDQVAADSGTFKLGLVVADDLMGGWTNRYTSEFSTRFGIENSLKRGWLSGTLWTSEAPTIQKVREETLITVYRAVYIQRHGFTETLQDMMHQEGFAMVMAGCSQHNLDEDDIAYTREVITPHLSSPDYPTVIVCLFGDQAAHALGYKPKGLSARAGLSLALHQALSSKSSARREG